MNFKDTSHREPRDAFDTFKPLNGLLKIFCFKTLIRKNERIQKSSSLKPKLAIIAALSAIIVLILSEIVQRSINFVNNTSNTRFRDSFKTLFIFGFTQYIIDASYAYKFGGNTNFCYFKIYENIDKILGTRYNTIVKEKVLKLTVFISTSVIITSMTVFCEWIFINDTFNVTYLEMFRDVMSGVFFFIYNLCLTELAVHAIQIEYRLKTIKELLQDFYFLTDKKLDLFEVVGNKNWFYFPKDMGTTKIRKNLSKTLIYYDNFFENYWLNKCYLFLIEQNNYLNKVFGFRVSKNMFMDEF